ncbi:hypothetical protein EVAR_32721_1 [Eumeta japonica]|uniref:Uncharacterized protein n=1 Tax=Eumeta variegata TaxID=151549 RepID=A0A4C1ZBV5_EUMVA|nr:hypothetical protein EVAR_32721_1 [Eumeta japonica]
MVSFAGAATEVPSSAHASSRMRITGSYGAADRRPSVDNGPPTSAQGSTHRLPAPRISNRARRRPLIRLSTDPTAAVKATRVSEPLPPYLSLRIGVLYVVRCSCTRQLNPAS